METSQLPPAVRRQKSRCLEEGEDAGSEEECVSDRGTEILSMV